MLQLARLVLPLPLQEPEEAAVITVRVNVGPLAVPAEFGLSHRAYVEAWRSCGEATGTHMALSQPRGRIALVGSMARLVRGLRRRKA
jgi:hypothetical protein